MDENNVISESTLNKNTIKFRQSADVLIVIYFQKTYPTNLTSSDSLSLDSLSSDSLLSDTLHAFKSNIIIGPIIDRIYCVNNMYTITLESYTDLLDICKRNFTEICQSAVDDKVHYKTKYKEFRKYFKIVCVEKINDATISLTDVDMINDLDFMQSEIITCMMHMDLLKQRCNISRNVNESLENTSDMKRYNFYDNMINKQQHLMFQISTAEQYVEYLNKIAKILDKNTDDVDVTLKEKQIMNNVMNISNTMW